jgi:cell division protein FtsL
MMTLSGKTAQIRQLKEEIKELKDSKEIKSTAKKGRLTSMEESVSLVEGGVLSLGTKIME